MEILNNFSSIYCFIAFVIGAVFMLAMLSIAAMGKVKETRNKVHFYVARDKNGPLCLYIGKPIRDRIIFIPCREKGVLYMGRNSELKKYGLNENDYEDLKWEDEPVEVFLNLED